MSMESFLGSPSPEEQTVASTNDDQPKTTTTTTKKTTTKKTDTTLCLLLQKGNNIMECGLPLLSHDQYHLPLMVKDVDDDMTNESDTGSRILHAANDNSLIVHVPQTKKNPNKFLENSMEHLKHFTHFKPEGEEHYRSMCFNGRPVKCEGAECCDLCQKKSQKGHLVWTVPENMCVSKTEVKIHHNIK